MMGMTEQPARAGHVSCSGAGLRALFIGGIQLGPGHPLKQLVSVGSGHRYENQGRARAPREGCMPPWLPRLGPAPTAHSTLVTLSTEFMFQSLSPALAGALPCSSLHPQLPAKDKGIGGGKGTKWRRRNRAWERRGRREIQKGQRK